MVKTRQTIKKYIILHILFAFYSIIMIVAKLASKYKYFSTEFIMLFALELAMLFIYAICWQNIIKYFELISAFSQKSIVMFWILVGSVFIFDEKITLYNIAGVSIIIIGIIIMESKND